MILPCEYGHYIYIYNFRTKLITEVAVTDVDSVCIITGETGTRVVSSDFMIAALADLEVVLEQVTGRRRQ